MKKATTTQERLQYKTVQAINVDYEGTSFDRGHLNPNFYHCDKARVATFTLTNAVPQDPCFNQQTWYKMEVRTKQIMREFCGFPGARRYIVTGAVPRNRMIPNEEHDRESDRERDYNRVSVPSHMWTAVCCDSSSALNPSDRARGFSFGYFGENVAESFVIPSNVEDLENSLRRFYNRRVQIFADDCFQNSPMSKKALNKAKVPVNVMKLKTLQSVSTMKGSTVPRKKRKLDVKIRKAIGNVPGDWIITDAYEGMLLKRDEVSDARKTFAALDLGLLLITGAKFSPTTRDELDQSSEFQNANKSTQEDNGVEPDNEHEYAKVSQVSSGGVGKKNLHHYKNQSHNGPKASLGGTKPHPRSVMKFKSDSSDRKVYLVIEQYDRDFTIEGDWCRQDSACGFHGKEYMWCYTDWDNNWDYCCNGSECIFLNGQRYTRCWTGDTWRSCSIRSSLIAVSGKRCLQDHECGLHGESYYWCYTDLAKSWDYCCQPSHVCDYYGETYKWCYTGETLQESYQVCHY